jgi:hypothetical protein
MHLTAYLQYSVQLMLMNDGSEAMTIRKADENKLIALVVEFTRSTCHTLRS